jgi:hypothetical protein
MLLERLHTAFLCWEKLGLQHFERQSADGATNTPLPVTHVEINSIAREMVVPRIGCGHQRHDQLFSNRGYCRTLSIFRLAENESTSQPDLGLATAPL